MTAKIVKPGPIPPPGGPGRDPGESVLSRVARTNEAVVEAMGTMKVTTAALHDSLKVNTSKIENHNTKIAQNSAKVDALIAKMDELIAAVKENTEAIKAHKDATDSSATVIKNHQAASEKLVSAVEKLR